MRGGGRVPCCKGSVTQTLNALSRRAGYEENRRLSFWLSFDPDAQTVKYGKGHHMEARLPPPLPTRYALVFCLARSLQEHAHSVLVAMHAQCLRQQGL